MSTPLKIAAIVPYKVYPPKMGGQKAIALFYGYLSRIVSVNIISVSNNEIPSGQKMYPALGNSKLRYINPFLFLKLKKLMKENSFTHLMIEHPYMGWLALLLKRSLKIPLIVKSHNIEALRFKSIGKWWWRILWQYEKFVHRHADKNFFITEEDKIFAVKNFRLEEKNCHTITYGTERSKAAGAEEKLLSGKRLRSKHSIKADEKILLFNGSLGYQPNTAALDVILNHINPFLLSQQGNFKYKIIICGNNLPVYYNKLESYSDKNIIYAGFVENIEEYFTGSDIFINPVIGGGGIKTKLVEALAAGLSSVSTVSGAIGVPQELTGHKMYVTPDNDWYDFAEKIRMINNEGQTPDGFFEYFYWGNIVNKATELIHTLSTQKL